MNKKVLTIIIIILAIAGFWTTKNLVNKTKTKTKIAMTQSSAPSYWTCPMHPQIHLDHPGECPICHMKLIKVASEPQQHEADMQNEHRAKVSLSGDQPTLLGIQKYEVEKMNLISTIPVSGRVISSSLIALQIYEDDLRYVHPGLSFSGHVGAYADEEIFGTITSVDSIADPSSRTIRVVGSIKKGPHRLVSEASFRGEIKIELKDKIVIPESAVLHTGNGDLVYLFGDKNTLSAKQITLGMKAEGYYEVLSGLSVGDFISSGPNFLIDSEAKIRGTSDPDISGSKPSRPTCPEGQHWDIPMSMCMPGKDSK